MEMFWHENHQFSRPNGPCLHVFFLIISTAHRYQCVLLCSNNSSKIRVPLHYTETTISRIVLFGKGDWWKVEIFIRQNSTLCTNTLGDFSVPQGHFWVTWAALMGVMSGELEIKIVLWLLVFFFCPGKLLLVLPASLALSTPSQWLVNGSYTHSS